jgi:hypothetical protein
MVAGEVRGWYQSKLLFQPSEVAQMGIESASDMMIDDDTLKQLLRIDDELMRLCKWLNEKRDIWYWRKSVGRATHTRERDYNKS